MGAPGLVHELLRSHAVLALLVFAVPQVSAFFIEAPLLVAADRWPRSQTVAGALLTMALGMVGCGLAPNAWLFALAFALSANASGVACAIAQTAMVEADPSGGERAMTRWSFAGMLGDLAAPVLVWAAATWVGWRAGFVVAAGALALWSLGVMRQAPVVTPALKSEAEEEPSFVAAVRSGLRNAPLMTWLLAEALCTLMDETLASFGAILVHERSSSSPELVVTVALSALSIGAMAGLAVTDRSLAKHPARSDALLISACLGCTITYTGWLLLPTPTLSIVALLLVGFFVAPMYPLSKARAYRAAPGRGGLVNALGQLFTTIDVVVPLGLGVLADRHGVQLALAFLLLQPLGVLIATLLTSRRRKDMKESRD